MLINQSTVMAAGGFPYTISQSGSYRLSGKLDVPANTNAIVISASDVIIDLNGFSIIAPQGPLPPGTQGIAVSGNVTGIAIRNGNIRGFTTPINPLAAKYWLLEDLLLEGGTTSGLYVGSFSIVRRVRVPNQQINVTCPSLVADSAVYTIQINLGGSGNCTFVNNATLF